MSTALILAMVLAVGIGLSLGLLGGGAPSSRFPF